MKFIEAIKALGPGQLLVEESGTKFELRDGELYRVGSMVPWIANLGWRIEDKPRPRVKFADAIAAAAKGAIIKSVIGDTLFEMRESCLANSVTGEPQWLSPGEQAREWEIIEAEDGK